MSRNVFFLFFRLNSRVCMSLEAGEYSFFCFSQVFFEVFLKTFVSFSFVACQDVKNLFVVAVTAIHYFKSFFDLFFVLRSTTFNSLKTRFWQRKFFPDPLLLVAGRGQLYGCGLWVSI
jgi:hypothetical protein